MTEEEFVSTYGFEFQQRVNTLAKDLIASAEREGVPALRVLSNMTTAFAQASWPLASVLLTVDGYTASIAHLLHAIDADMRRRQARGYRQ